MSDRSDQHSWYSTLCLLEKHKIAAVESGDPSSAAAQERADREFRDTLRRALNNHLADCFPSWFATIGRQEKRFERGYGLFLRQLNHSLQLPRQPAWLQQVHGCDVCIADACDSIPEADASFSNRPGIVCAVLTADCLPILLCSSDGEQVAAIHAGWRGLHAGILSATLAKMQSPAEDILVSLGPAIGPEAFEVGQDVYDAFVSNNDANSQAFITMDATHYLCDIYKLARIELSAAGVKSIAGGVHCSFNEAPLFYSYRRQSSTGRMASLIWIG